MAKAGLLIVSAGLRGMAQLCWEGDETSSLIPLLIKLRSYYQALSGNGE